LLDAGIDVFTSLNVQHIESLNDVVVQITHQSVSETVPDSVVEHADEVRLIDLPPDELLARLRDGKVYSADQARRALEHFFRKGNLNRAARAGAASDGRARRLPDASITVRPRHRQHLVGWRAVARVREPQPASVQLIRGARPHVSTLHADWLAVYVETPTSLRLNAEDRARAAENMRLAEQLGARR